MPIRPPVYTDENVKIEEGRRIIRLMIDQGSYPMLRDAHVRARAARNKMLRGTCALPCRPGLPL
jgi:hypothetical protein